VAKRKKEIPVAKVDVDDGTAKSSRICEQMGCNEPAEHRAPKNRQSINEYYWFCLEHVQAYNRSWDYFDGMSPDEIEKYRVEAVTGHRPTWKMGQRGFSPWHPNGVHDPHDFLDDSEEFGGSFGASRGIRYDRKQRKALAELDLDESANLQDIKMRYKQLVKRYHPDANGGDKGAEERFKSINEAYSYLVASGSV
jgi:hypothetical protein